jgi:hypothetical protein
VNKSTKKQQQMLSKKSISRTKMSLAKLKYDDREKKHEGLPI